MKDLSPLRHRLMWLAPAMLGTLLVLPATRYLLRTQLRMQALTYTTQTNLPAERLAAMRVPEDYPVQLALASQMPASYQKRTPFDRDAMPGSNARNRRIEALAERFPNHPSAYANLLRYRTDGDVALHRELSTSNAIVPSQPSAASREAIALFIVAAQKGAALDPDNAYFPMMEALGFMAVNYDRQALESLKTAGRCSQWKEYWQDDVNGQVLLRRAAYGEQGAVSHLAIAGNLQLPHYAQLRAVARIAVRLAAEGERAGNTAEGVAVRHALMRCGGLMRAQGATYSAALGGIALSSIATNDPGGVLAADSFGVTAARNRGKDAKQLRAERLERYYAYLERLGQVREAAWARTEIAAGEQAKAIMSEASQTPAYSGRDFFRLGLCWLANDVLLSSALVLLFLGAMATLASRIRPRKALGIGRFVFALFISGGIGLWQWQATRGGISPYIEVRNMFSAYGESDRTDTVQSLVACLGLLTPTLLVVLIAGLSRFQRIPLATGLGRGLRGIAIPTAALMFLLYGVSLLPTAYMESIDNTYVAQITENGPRHFAEVIGKVWPGDPRL